MPPPRCGCSFGILSGLEEMHRHVGRADDLVVVMACRFAVSLEHDELVPDDVRAPTDVGRRPMLGYQPQRDPLAAPADS